MVKKIEKLVLSSKSYLVFADFPVNDQLELAAK